MGLICTQVLLAESLCGQAPAIRLIRDESEAVVAITAGPLSAAARGTPASNASESPEMAWESFLSVRVAAAGADSDLPAVLGRYQDDQKELRFTPKYPFRPGVNYRVEFAPEGTLSSPARSTAPATTAPATTVTVTFTNPVPPAGEPTRVTAVYPSAAVLPENLLRFYLEFSGPMRPGDVYQYIQLLGADGQPIDLPFLEIGEELWDPQMRRLTLLIDPGRIKRGVKPLEDIGPVLEDGKQYTLVVDQKWPDEHGRPLAATFRKRFKAGPVNRQPLDPANWRVAAPKWGSLEPLVVHFPWPLDVRILQRAIVVEQADGSVVAGRAEVYNEEKSWRWLPEKPWSEETLSLAVDLTLEDPVGNRIGRAFEVDQLEPIGRRVAVETMRIPVRLKR